MKIIKSENKIEIKVAPNKDWKYAFVFIPAGIIMIPFFFFALFVLLISLVKLDFNKFIFEALGIFLLAFTIINYSLWLLIGKEKVIFSENLMIYNISNGIFGRTKQVEIASIKNLKTVDKVYNSELPFIPDTGRINFDYKGKYFSILRGLKDDEIKDATEIFNEQILKNSL
ncbi:hypothetical protein WMW71_12890 [Flavobacterium buctense]|uniref:DUF304 domain-containing protein n=1 Tax=Flavobacterium buctense TaxID=1648146 RepID=A0ABU9E3L3_9FLAO|nr:hypothetical protein [Flavobacterium buctense]